MTEIRQMPKVKVPPIELPAGFEMRRKDDATIIRDATHDTHVVFYGKVRKSELRHAIRILQMIEEKFA